jgi:uncharacterized protein YdeI (BOF family)
MEDLEEEHMKEYEVQTRKTVGFPGVFLLAVTIASLAATGALAGEKDPYKRANNTWITISGEVKNVTPDTFTLDYGKGVVTVEMDDGDRDADAYKLIEGDKVTVNGKIDDDLYETTKIEASSVYVEKLGTYFYASPVDEEDVFFYTLPTPIVVGDLVVRGTVTDVDDHEFTVDTGFRKLRVEVATMPYNPLDDEGYQKIRVGDFVKVSGTLDHDFFEGRELEARSVVKLAG